MTRYLKCFECHVVRSWNTWHAFTWYTNQRPLSDHDTDGENEEVAESDWWFGDIGYVSGQSADDDGQQQEVEPSLEGDESDGFGGDLEEGEQNATERNGTAA